MTRERALKALAGEVHVHLGLARQWLTQAEEGGDALAMWRRTLPWVTDDDDLRERVRMAGEWELELAESMHMAAEALEAQGRRPEAAHAFVPADVGPLCRQCGGTADGHLRFALEAMTGGRSDG